MLETGMEVFCAEKLDFQQMHCSSPLEANSRISLPDHVRTTAIGGNSQGREDGSGKMHIATCFRIRYS